MSLESLDSSPSSGVRLAEVMAMLSTATDLAMSQPLEFAVTSCLVSLRLGEVLKLPETTLREIYYQSLLRYIGCNAETATFAAIAGDEMSIRGEIVAIDTADRGAIMRLMVRSIRQANAGESTLGVAREIVRGIAALPGVTKEFFQSHCEVAQQLASRLGFEPGIVTGLGQLYERWDGKGQPQGLKGEAVAPAVRAVSLVQDALTFHRLGDLESAVAMVRERRGAAYDPAMADAFCASAATIMTGLDDPVRWETVVALEPGQRRTLSEAELETACGAMADFTDVKSPFMIGHSHRVAELASAAARNCKLPAQDRAALQRAALLHDIGRSGITSRIWSKPGALSDQEWDQVRLYPYHTQRILSRPASFDAVAAIAASHRERLDGCGYHRGLAGSALSTPARILAIADAYCAMLEERPYRPARSPEYAAMELRRAASEGHADSEITEAVLDAAGHRTAALPGGVIAGLTEREVEVLRLLARGKRKREIASELSIAEKTADNHVQHIYEKIGVTTRAAAALYAVQRGLL